MRCKSKCYFFCFLLLLLICFPAFLFRCEAKSAPVKITLFHLNDTYHIGPVQIKQKTDKNKEKFISRGGMARIRTYIKTYQNNHPEIPLLILHAGDMISPSVLSWKEGLKGKQMIDILNRLPVHLAVFGNHEFDFGCKILEKRIKESKFKWLASNIKFPEAGSIFQLVNKIHIFEHQGIKIGFFGLTIDFRSEMPCHQHGGDKIFFQDPVKAAKRAVQTLKAKKVDIIVGITHLNMSTDKKIAAENPEIDLIIGGHEHTPLNALVGKTLIRKAGVNAKELGKVELTYFSPLQNNEMVLEKKWELIPINDKIPPDPDLKKIVDKYTNRINQYNTNIGNTSLPLEARSVCMRTHETNIGSLVADLIRTEGKGELSLINGGAFRSDKIIPAGAITTADIYSMLPYNDVIMTIEIDGKTILEAMENGLTDWGSRKGRFPQVSGIKFKFDPARPNYKKIISGSVEIQGKPLKLTKIYKLSTIDFLVERGEIDGYTMFHGKKIIGKYGDLTDVLIKYIHSKKTISPVFAQRILIHGPDPLMHHKCGDPNQVF